jgi:hypothetical protein
MRNRNNSITDFGRLESDQNRGGYPNPFLIIMDPRCLYLADDLILLNKNIFNNGNFEGALYQIHTGGKIIDRDNISRRSVLRILSECRDIDSRISFTFSDL